MPTCEGSCVGGIQYVGGMRGVTEWLPGASVEGDVGYSVCTGRYQYASGGVYVMCVCVKSVRTLSKKTVTSEISYGSAKTNSALP